MRNSETVNVLEGRTPPRQKQRTVNNLIAPNTYCRTGLWQFVQRLHVFQLGSDPIGDENWCDDVTLSRVPEQLKFD
jgi:hypothetical protein